MPSKKLVCFQIRIKAKKTVQLSYVVKFESEIGKFIWMILNVCVFSGPQISNLCPISF